LLSTHPERQAVLTEWTGPVVFTFDETLSENGVRDAALVSPETGRATIERDGNELKVNVEGGWNPQTIYRVVILPGIRDRFGNIRREPTELVFSTGPPLQPTAIAGLVTDRITGRPLGEMRVTALSFPDSSIPHATVTDTAGFFGLRYLPLGRYTVRAFEDRNRNKKLDAGEKRAQQSIVIGTVRDTQVVQFALLAPDTTPARLLRAESRDSLAVRLTFDDFLDPEKPLQAASVRVAQLPDSVPVSGARVLHVREYQELMRTRADSALPARPTPPEPAADTAARPLQEAVLLFPSPLASGTRYRIDLSGITNIAEVPNGGGVAHFETARRDTTAVGRDTTGLRRDTVGTNPVRR
jgi:hypothetical protein